GGKGGWAKHREVRILGDGALVVAPPSVHVDTRKPYAFFAWSAPAPNGLPPEAPEWLLSVPILRPPAPELAPIPKHNRPERVILTGKFSDSKQVIDAIPDKIALAAEWGLRVTGSRGKGWFNCHAADREDRNPSASIHEGSGWYMDFAAEVSESFFDL